ncbi:MAG TPA: hypothetical protein VIK53_17980 [Verrucomicrobiae bacterium]
MKKSILPVFGAVVLLCSCVPSVNPFYTDKDVVTDPRLPGVWQEAGNDKPSVWKFEAGETNSYKLTVTEDTGKTGEFNAHLFKLGEEHFLDLIPTGCDYATNQAELVGVAMIPGHLLVRCSPGESKMHLALCDPDWLKKFLGKNPNAIAHRNDEDLIVLTAETDALQQFVLNHLGKDELFSDGGDFIRQTNDVPAAPK